MRPMLDAVGSSVRVTCWPTAPISAPPLPLVGQPHWLLGFCAFRGESHLEYGERARVRTIGVLSVISTDSSRFRALDVL
jgi:hypothetical protein